MAPSTKLFQREEPEKVKLSFEGTFGEFIPTLSHFKFTLKPSGVLTGCVNRGPRDRVSVDISNRVVRWGHIQGSYTVIGKSTQSTDNGKMRRQSTSSMCCEQPPSRSFRAKYCCQFLLSRTPDLSHNEYYDCRVHVSKDLQVMSGSYALINATSSPRVSMASRSDGTFRLSKGHADPQPKSSQLSPLSSGIYYFNGCATMTAYENTRSGRKRRIIREECCVTLRLHPDGIISGTSQETGYPQTCPIKGSWEAPNRLEYILEYHVRDAVGMFQYYGTVTSPTDVSGSWRNVDDVEELSEYQAGRGNFTLSLKRKQRLPSDKKWKKDPVQEPNILNVDDDDDAIHVLTAGRYELKGRAMDADGYEYGSRLQIKLLPNGTLEGTCQEEVFTQVRTVYGRWMRSHLWYDEDFVVGKQVGTYRFQGSVDEKGAIVSGRWSNIEENSTSNVCNRNIHKTNPSECGTFAFTIISATRTWTLSCRYDFPSSFRLAADVLETISTGSQTHLNWGVCCMILSFCSESWFEVDEVE